MNWTRNDDVMRRTLKVRVPYGTNVERVLKLLDELTGGHPKVLRDPPHRIWFDGFGESTLEFTVWCFTRIDDGLRTMTELYQQIDERFKEAGIEIAVPRQELRVKHEDTALGGLLEGRSD